MRMTVRFRSIAGTALMACMVLTCLGCRKNQGPVVYPVSGQVFFEQRPAERALVIFHPVGGGDVRPHGEVKADGSFTLATTGQGDGAPPGDYVVTVEWWLASGRRDDDSPAVNRLPPRYANPATSGLTARVEHGPTTLKPFELKR